MNDVGKGAYLRNLEKAREAIQAREARLDSVGSKFKVESAEEQAADAAQGLMRPRARPEPESDSGEGFGMGLMRSLRPQARPEDSSGGSIRPQARPEGNSGGSPEGNSEGNSGGSPEAAPEKRVRPRSRTRSEPQGGRSVSADQTAIYDGLIKRGMKPHIAQGFMSNFRDESAFKLDITEAEANVHGTFGKGLYQRTGSRREAYESKYGNDWSLDNQLDALMVELATNEKSAWNKIKNTKTAGEAGASIVTNFLRPAAKHRKARAASYRDGSGLWSL